MKLTLQIEVETDDGSTPLFEDVANAIRKQLAYLELSWKDPSLGRVLSAAVVVNDIVEN